MGQSRSDKSFLRTTAAWALLTGLAAGPAFAQTAPAQTPDADAPITTPAPQSTETADDNGEDTIVVTGSRLHANEFTSSSPIQVITMEHGALSGTADVAELLQSSSLAAGSPQNDATISSAFVTEGGPGSQTISLRGLGANRTLVLVNGRRGGPAGTRGEVSAFDLNVVPSAVVDRFEILKDGASSIYGSDAVAGVVNIITRRDFDGADFTMYANAPWEQGGAEYSAEAVWGHTFDRGYITASVDWYRHNELTLGDRKYTSCGVNYMFNSATGQRSDTIDPRTGKPQCDDILAGQIWLYEYSYSGAFADGEYLDSPDGRVLVQWDPSGQIGALFPETIFPGTQVDETNPTSPSGWVGLNQVDPVTRGATNASPEALQNATLWPKLERYTAFFQMGYDITASTEAYAEVLLSRRTSEQHGVRQYWTYLFSYDYFYPGFGSIAPTDSLNAGWLGSAILSPTPITGRAGSSQEVDYYRVVAGVKGSFDGWLGAFDWDVYVQGSHSDASYSQDVLLQDAMDQSKLRNDFGVNFGGGYYIDRPTASCVGYTTPVSNKPCVDVNWLDGDFLNGHASPEVENFLFDTETGTTIYDQVYLEGTISGDVFTMPAGNVGAVLGVNVRRDRLNDTPGAVTLAHNVWGASTADVTKGSDNTQEVFGELGIPIVRGVPALEDVSLTLSGRYTDVESYGSDSTYKVGLNWQLNHDWRFRVTQGTSFRAPALFEQFLGNQTGFLSQRQIDPCIRWATNLAAGNISQRVADNCAADGIPGNYSGAGASATVTKSGGDVEAETSEAFTGGIVWTPGFADLSVAIDYFDIKVENEVTTLGAGVILFGCYNSTHFTTEALCNLFTRGQTASPYLINTVTDDFLNIAEQRNRGIDLTTRYTHQFPWGDFSVQGQFTWQFEDSIALIPEVTQDNNARVGDPQFVGNLDFRLDRGDWTFFWDVQTIGHSSDSNYTNFSSASGATNFKIDTEATTYHNVSVRYRMDRFDIIVGLRNASDETPPALSDPGFSGGSGRVGYSVLASQYDYIGRTGFVSVKAHF
ncbi:MAG TPA: TonB-dependent receptor [Caulobacterales bacterium]|nr:TonB-dependent receptor [Caulobacterales bacterium]